MNRASLFLITLFLTFVTLVRAEDHYYLNVFAYQAKQGNPPELSHTFGTFTAFLRGEICLRQLR